MTDSEQWNTFANWATLAFAIGIQFVVVWPRLRNWYIRKRWPHWSNDKRAGYLLTRLVDEMPVKRKHGKYEIVELKDIEAKQF